MSIEGSTQPTPTFYETDSASFPITTGPPNPNSPDSGESSNNQTNKKVVVGAVVGSVLASAVVVFIIYGLILRSRRKRNGLGNLRQGPSLHRYGKLLGVRIPDSSHGATPGRRILRGTSLAFSPLGTINPVQRSPSLISLPSNIDVSSLSTPRIADKTDYLDL